MYKIRRVEFLSARHHSHITQSTWHTRAEFRQHDADRCLDLGPGSPSPQGVLLTRLPTASAPSSRPRHPHNAAPKPCSHILPFCNILIKSSCTGCLPAVGYSHTTTQVFESCWAFCVCKVLEGLSPSRDTPLDICYVDKIKLIPGIHIKTTYLSLHSNNPCNTAVGESWNPLMTIWGMKEELRDSHTFSREAIGELSVLCFSLLSK